MPDQKQTKDSLIMPVWMHRFLDAFCRRDLTENEIKVIVALLQLAETSNHTKAYYMIGKVISLHARSSVSQLRVISDAQGLDDKISSHH